MRTKKSKEILTIRRNVLVLVLLVLAFCGSVVFAGRRTAKIKNGDEEATTESMVDTGATDNNGTSHPSEIDRDTAQDIGIIDSNGNPNPDQFEKDPADPNKIKKERYHIADCSYKEYGVTTPVTITVTDDANETVDAEMPVTVSLDPNSEGSNLLGEDWMRRVDITIKYVPEPGDPNGPRRKKVTFNNTEEDVSHSMRMPQNIGEPISDGQDRMVWPGTGFAGGNTLSINVFLATGSPYNIMPMNTAVALGMAFDVNDIVDLGDSAGALYHLYKAGFISMENDPGLFYVTTLPKLDLHSEEDVNITYEAVKVLVPVGSCAEEPVNALLIGSDMLDSQVGYVFGDETYIKQITFIGEFEDMWFTPSGPIGDLDGDLDVDFSDFSTLAQNWLENFGELMPPVP